MVVVLGRLSAVDIDDKTRVMMDCRSATHCNGAATFQKLGVSIRDGNGSSFVTHDP